MKRAVKWLSRSLVAGGVGLFIIFSAGIIQGKEAGFIQFTDYGEIDWGVGVITARGTGLEAARQNLWEMIKGVRMDNHRLVGELISHNAGLKEQLQQLVSQTKTVEESKLASGRTEIKLKLPFKGPFTEAILAVQQVGDTSRLPARHGPPASNPAPIGPTFILGTTGLVVDARGLGVEPALAPRILTEDERLIYGLTKVSRSYAMQQGLVVYMRDLAIAEANKWVANNPIVIKALQAGPEGNTDLIISDQDVDRISRASQRHDFLYKCRVIIVID